MNSDFLLNPVQCMQFDIDSRILLRELKPERSTPPTTARVYDISKLSFLIIMMNFIFNLAKLICVF